MNMTHQKTRYSTKGFSLFEIILVIAIIAVIAAASIPNAVQSLRNSRVTQIQQTVQTLKTATVDYLAMGGANGALPRTEGTGIPCSGTALSAASDAAKGNGARFDAILLAVGKLEKPITLKSGSQAATSSGSGNEMVWSQALQAWTMTPDAAPQRNWAQVARVETRGVNAALAPSVAQGANFRLDGTSNLNANATVEYLVIPGMAAGDAYQLALTLVGTQLVPAEGAACDNGVVAYAAPVNGLTDVFVYISVL
ncbi:MAG: hypothetical protein JWM32_1283 [Verrucomicrobia bacterium]|nr:hypothetical protein [Verrucomicrobiota bacterium]